MSKHSEEIVREICTNHGHTYVGSYLNARTKFDCICSCGANWSTVLTTIQRGSKCSECNGVCITRTNDSVNEELSSYGLTLLQPYINGNIPIIYECTCGGIGKTTLGNIRRGDRCGFCIENKWRNYFCEYGCEIVEYNSQKVKYICHCGELYSTQIGPFKNGNKKCPKCRVNWNYKVNKIGRPVLFKWKRAVIQRDEFKCQSCSTDDRLEIHHIEAYSVSPELADTVDNGITLCYDCHKSLHKKYGIQVGRKNLSLELTTGGF